VTSTASAPGTNVTPIEQNAPQTTTNKVVTPETFSQEPSNAESLPQPLPGDAVVPAAAQ
jgi:hypothetical protein